ncbi:MAG TPA: redoxin domain-containing protein [Kribbella sp.]|nr:redoxin domain-containing protein [Kribbella sp.]
MSKLCDQMAAAEAEWLDKWAAGPIEKEGSGLPAGTQAPDLVLADHTGHSRPLSDSWSERPALLMFWRHFGCGCGVDRAELLRTEYEGYREAGLNPVIIAQGEPERAAAYRTEHALPCPVLCDPDHVAYRAYGVGQWAVERVLFDAPAAYWTHLRHLGVSFQDDRRSQGRPPVDDPWRGAAEFVIGTGGVVRLCYSYQYCEDFPDPRVLTTAARLS